MTSSPATDLVPKVPKVPTKRKDDLVISRSKRPKLGGKVTQVTLKPNGQHVVSGEGIETKSFKGFAEALRYARTGQASEAKS